MKYSVVALAVFTAVSMWPTLDAKAATKIDPVCEGYLLNSPHYEVAVQTLDPRIITGAAPMKLTSAPLRPGQAHLNNLHGMGDRFDIIPVESKLTSLKTSLTAPSRAGLMFLRHGWLSAFTAKAGAKANIENAEHSRRRLERVLNLALREFHGVAGEMGAETVVAIRGAIIDEISVYLTELNISHRVVSRVHDRGAQITDLYVEVLNSMGETIGKYDPNQTFTELTELRQSVAEEVVAYVTKPAEVAAVAAKPDQELTTRANEKLEASRLRVIARMRKDHAALSRTGALATTYLGRMMAKTLENKISAAENTRITVAQLPDAAHRYFTFKFENTQTGTTELQTVDVELLKAN